MRLPAPARAHHHRGRQRAVHHADDEHPGAAPGRRVRRDAAAVPSAPGQLDVHAVDAGRAVGGTTDAGHHRRQSRVQRGRRSPSRCSTATRSTPRPRSPTSASRRAGPGEGIVTLRAHRPQPARRRRRDRVAKDHGAQASTEARSPDGARPDRARLAVLPGRPTRAVREGRCRSRRRDPRPRGRRGGQGPGGRPRRADRHPAGSGVAPWCGSTRSRHRGPRARPRGAGAHRLHDRDAGQDRVRRAGRVAGAAAT